MALLLKSWGEIVFVAFEAAAPRYDGIFGGILNILTKPKPRIEEREAFGAAYGVIIAGKPVSDSDWRKIASLAGRYGDMMLFPEGITPPPPLREAVFPRFTRRLILGTAIEIVKRTRMPMYRRVAGLVDEKGEYADFLFELLHHYTTVKVFSKQHELYEAEAARMMEELGAPVILCDNQASLSDCVLIIAPDGMKTRVKPVCPVLGKPGEMSQSGDFITDLRFIPQAKGAKLCPNGIEQHKFFAALYEYCGVKDVGQVATRMTFRHADSDLTKVVHAVMQAAGVLSVF